MFLCGYTPETCRMAQVKRSIKAGNIDCYSFSTSLQAYLFGKTARRNQFCQTNVLANLLKSDREIDIYTNHDPNKRSRMCKYIGFEN